MAEEQSPEVKRQVKFVAWLKANSLYNEFENAPTMVKLQRVWEACGSPDK